MDKGALLTIFLLLAVFTAACSAGLDRATENPAPTAAETEVPSQAVQDGEPAELPKDVPEELINRRVDMEQDLFFPTLLPYDAIRPIYEPEFVPANEAPLEDDELVIGISLNGEAKAYPITVLRSREMVNDELGGNPILVTW
jgi:hypothetical protein